MENNELDSKLVKQFNNGYERHTWLPGAHEGLGKVIDGWTGKETLVRKNVVKAKVVFDVKEADLFDEDIDGFQYNPARHIKHERKIK